ncbi:hypothetical protein HMPREF0774_2097, partial [Staphylococcus aureus subsp. aureus TCH130]
LDQIRRQIRSKVIQNQRHREKQRGGMAGKKRGITNNSLSGEPQRGKRNSIPSVMTKGR